MLRLLALLMGPIFAKEMVEMSRRRRYYFNRVVYGATLLLVLFLIWDSYRYMFNGYGYYAGGRYYQGQGGLLQAMAELAAAMFYGVSWVQCGSVFLFVPVFTCGVIAAEREAHTLDLLLTTQLHDREIVLGKLGSRLAVCLLLILSAIPVLSLVMLFGGISPAALWRTQAATLLIMVYAGAHAIYFSAVSRSPMGALLRTYWWMAVWILGVPAALVCLGELLNFGPWSWFAYIFYAQTFLNPLFVFVTAVFPEAHDEVARHVGGWFFPAAFVVPLAWSAFLMTRAVLRLRLGPTLLARVSGMIAGLRDTRQAWSDWRRDRLEGRRRRAPRTWWGLEVENPLWLRARLTPVYDREGHLGRIQLGGWLVAAFFLGIFVLFDADDLAHEEASMVFLGCTWLGAALLTGVVSASSLVGDRRRGMLELTLTTPLEPREIVDGTLLAVWHHLRPVFWLAWLLCGLFLLIGASHPIGVVASVTTATLFGGVLLLMGVMCSLVAQHPAQALAPVFLFGVFMNIGTGCMIGALEEGSAPLLWLGTVVLAPLSWMWVRRRPSAISVGALFLGMHLAFCSVATFWAWDLGGRGEFPLALFHPAFLTMVMLEDQFPSYEFSRSGSEGSLWGVPMYWAAMVANLVWARWFMIRHFDRLAGRLVPPEGASPFAEPVVTAELVPVMAGSQPIEQPEVPCQRL